MNPSPIEKVRTDQHHLRQIGCTSNNGGNMHDLFVFPKNDISAADVLLMLHADSDRSNLLPTDNTHVIHMTWDFETLYARSGRPILNS